MRRGVRLLALGGAGTLALAAPVAWYYRPQPSWVPREEDHAAEVSESNVLVKAARFATISSVCALSKTFIQGLNDFKIYHHDRFLRHARGARERGLVTVSNHTSVLDDPGIIAAISPPDVAFVPSRMRWGVCSEELCFSSGVLSAFFGSGKVFPIQRGAGVDQGGLAALGRKVGPGSWVHVFPEARCWQERGYPPRGHDGRRRMPPSRRPGPPGAQVGPLKWGVGKVVAEAEVTPVVLPMFHIGMDELMPQSPIDNECEQSIPNAFRRVRVMFGEEVPVQDLVDEYKAWKRAHYPDFDAWSEASLAAEPPELRERRQQTYAQITDRVEAALARLCTEIRLQQD